MLFREAVESTEAVKPLGVHALATVLRRRGRSPRVGEMRGVRVGRHVVEVECAKSLLIVKCHSHLRLDWVYNNEGSEEVGDISRPCNPTIATTANKSSNVKV